MQEGGGAQVTSRSSVRLKLSILAIALTVVALDQATKAWAVTALEGGRRIPLIGEVFDLRLVLNPGSAFGLFKGSTMMIFIASALITLAVVIWAMKDPYASPWLGPVIGGGLGNLIDRVFRPPGGGRGEVIDFIYLSFWPTFNVADAAIVVGVGAMLILSTRQKETVAS